MEVLNVIAAGAAGWLFGALWYGVMGKKWMVAAGLTDDTINNKNIAAFIGSFISALIVAGMMRHIFVTSGVTNFNDAWISGLGLGLFIATPWIATNYLFAQRPPALIFYDGVYATVGCTIMGIVLILF